MEEQLPWHPSMIFIPILAKNTYVFSSRVRNALLCMSLLSINCLTAGDTVIPELGAQSVAPMVQERIRQRKKGHIFVFVSKCGAYQS